MNEVKENNRLKSQVNLVGDKSPTRIDKASFLGKPKKTNFISPEFGRKSEGVKYITE